MIPQKNIILIATVLVCLCSLQTKAQSLLNATFGEGISLLAKDSSFSLSPSFRFQTQYSGRLNTQTQDWNETLMIRRARLKFDGFAFSPRVVYKVELALSNRDINSRRIPESGSTSNIVLDAVIKWNFIPRWTLWFGQTKLPGNRERVISSQDLQFVDRSPVNANFTLDRDVGIQLRHKSSLGAMILCQTFAVSLGEGRNIIVANPAAGRQYTARLELFPFGEFQGKGAYFGSDLAREPTPKLAIGVSGDFNNNTVRSRGNLGSFVTDLDDEYVHADLFTLFVDGMFKYRGLSAAFEYAYRDGNDQVSGFGYGEGITASSGYLFENDFEVAARYTSIDPIADLSVINSQDEYMLGFSRYIKGHNLKVQTDISYTDRENANDFFRIRVQTEVAL